MLWSLESEPVVVTVKKTGMMKMTRFWQETFKWYPTEVNAFYEWWNLTVEEHQHDEHAIIATDFDNPDLCELMIGLSMCKIK
eukprot:11117861-Karenia_brevis.AAC.1